MTAVAVRRGERGGGDRGGLAGGDPRQVDAGHGPVGLVGRLTRALDVQGGLLDVVAEREVVVPDLHHVALVEGDRALDLDAVDLDAVVTLEVLDDPAVGALMEAGVLARDVLLGELDGVARLPPDRDLLFAEGHNRRRTLFVLDDQSQGHRVSFRVGSGSNCCQARSVPQVASPGLPARAGDAGRLVSRTSKSRPRASEAPGGRLCVRQGGGAVPARWDRRKGAEIQCYCALEPAPGGAGRRWRSSRSG